VGAQIIHDSDFFSQVDTETVIRTILVVYAVVHPALHFTSGSTQKAWTMCNKYGLTSLLLYGSQCNSNMIGSADHIDPSRESHWVPSSADLQWQNYQGD